MTEIDRTLSIGMSDLEDLTTVWCFVMEHVDEFHPVHGIEVQRYTTCVTASDDDGPSHYSVRVWGDPA